MGFFRVLGVESPDQLPGWRPAGVREGGSAQGWVRAGVRCLADLASWRVAGICEPGDAVAWVWPQLVTSIAEVVAWKAAGESGPARLGAHPSAVATERYFYAYGHYCHPDVALDVIEVDYDAGGHEVSRGSRPVGRADRNQVAGDLLMAPGCGTVRTDGTDVAAERMIHFRPN